MSEPIDTAEAEPTERPITPEELARWHTGNRWRTAVHEAAHHVVADALGRRIGPASIAPGKTYSGIAFTGRLMPKADADRWLPRGVRRAEDPLTLPASIRRNLEVGAVVALAGPLAGDLIDPFSGYVEPGEDERRAAEAAALLTARDRSRIAAAAADPEPTKTDLEHAAWIAAELAGDLAALYLMWLRSFAVALMATHIRAIEAVADELLRATHLSGRRVREIIAAHPPVSATAPRIRLTTAR